MVWSQWLEPLPLPPEKAFPSACVSYNHVTYNKADIHDGQLHLLLTKIAHSASRTQSQQTLFSVAFASQSVLRAPTLQNLQHVARLHRLVDTRVVHSGVQLKLCFCSVAPSHTGICSLLLQCSAHVLMLS